MSNQYAIEINNLTKKFSDKIAVNNLSFNVKKGEVFGFLGPNGAGKTTTIRMILKLIFPDQGSIKINGHDIKKSYNKAISSIGAIVETPSFYKNLTGYKNLKLIANLYKDVKEERIQEVIKLVGVEKYINRKVKEYSLGMRQRLGIARSLLNNPKIVILDEPTNGLDPKGIKEVRALISELSMKQDITFVISSHLLYEIELMCDSVVILNEGKLIKQGSVKEILKEKDQSLEDYFLNITEGVQ